MLGRSGLGFPSSPGPGLLRGLREVPDGTCRVRSGPRAPGRAAGGGSGDAK